MSLLNDTAILFVVELNHKIDLAHILHAPTYAHQLADHKSPKLFPPKLHMALNETFPRH